MKKICDFLKNHFDFKIQISTWVGIIVALLIIPATMFLPEKYGFENGLIENLQLLVLFIGGYFALRPKTDKIFFNFILMVIGILFLREINCGRTIFFPVPGVENEFYRWSEIKYGYLAHPIYGAYIAFVGIYFLKNKLFINLWQKIKDIKFPVWNFVLLLIGMIAGIYAEEVVHNFILEESTELLFYVALINFVYLYSQNKDFIK